MAELTLASALAGIDRAIADNRAVDALDALRRLPRPARDSVDVIAREAELLGRIGEHEQEIALYRKLIAVQPDSAAPWVALANALRIVGRSEEAVATLRQALAVDPGHARAWGTLADLKDFRFDDRDIAAMTGLIECQTEGENIIALRFALGKAYEDRGEARRRSIIMPPPTGFAPRRSAAPGSGLPAVPGKSSRP